MDFSALVAILIVLATVYLMFKSEAVRLRGVRLRDATSPPSPPHSLTPLLHLRPLHRA